MCTVSATIALGPAYLWGAASSVICVDVYLLGLVFLFRALKRLQKWNNNESPEQSTFRYSAAPLDIRGWVIGCVAFSILALLATFLVPCILRTAFPVAPLG